MTLSIICLTANPTEKQYAWKEALHSYIALADEVIIVDGGTEDLLLNNEFTLEPKLHIIEDPDPPIWTWAEHAKKLNLGLAAATGDWIIKVDIDWVFHESNMTVLRQKLAAFLTYQYPLPAATMQKYTFYPFRRYIQKGQVPIIINKQFKERVRFGKDRDVYTDLTYPIWWDGTDIDQHGVPVGKLIERKEHAKTGELFWNFDYTFSTLDQMKRKWARMSQSHKVYFGETDWGETEEDALREFISKQQAKHHQALDIMDGDMIPKYIRQRIRDLTPEHFGHSAWGLYTS